MDPDLDPRGPKHVESLDPDSDRDPQLWLPKLQDHIVPELYVILAIHLDLFF